MEGDNRSDLAQTGHKPFKIVHGLFEISGTFHGQFGTLNSLLL